MPKTLLVLWMATLVAMAAGAAESRVTEPFDSDWRFLQSDATGAESGGFDDSTWRAVNVPHDWSIAGPFAATNKTGGARPMTM